MRPGIDEIKLPGGMQVDAERSALDRENWALRGAGVFSGKFWD